LSDDHVSRELIQFLQCKCGSHDISSEMIRYRGVRSHKTTCNQCHRAFHYQWHGRSVESAYLKGEVSDMQTATLSSSILDTASYDDARDVLLVRFKNGTEYEYAADLKAEPPTDMRVLYISFVHAESPGKFFAMHIRGKLPFRKLEPLKEAE
jgi:hypothetical protein